MTMVHLLLVFLSAIVVVQANHVDSPIELYWHSMLPNTTMPRSIRQLIVPGGHSNRVKQPDCLVGYILKSLKTLQNVSQADILSSLFLKKNLYPGAQLKDIHLMERSIHGNVFVPREEADMISFSSKNLPKIFEHFSMVPGSDVAKLMENALRICEVPSLEGETGSCSTSLESMIDNVISLLGTHDIRAVTTTGSGALHGKGVYTVASNSLMRKFSETDRIVICHPLASPQAIYYCHTSNAYQASIVPLVGSDRSTVNALTLCHRDLNNFSKYILSVLKVDSDMDSICHFLPEDHIVWVSKS